MKPGWLILMFILTQSWLPWNEMAYKEIEGMTVELFDPNEVYDRSVRLPPRGSCGDGVLYISTSVTWEGWQLVMVHEFTHHLQHSHIKYEDLTDGKFKRLALKCLKEGKFGKKAIVEGIKFLNLHEVELHAQLPWLTKGKLCPKLQDYYPWLDLTPSAAIPGRP